MSDARRFTGGRIFTGHRYVEALLVEDGRVVSAGSESEVRRSSPPGCEVESLAGGLVLPGLVDAHLHLAEIVRAREGLPLEGLRSREELAERLRFWATHHPHGPIVGRGWSVEEFGDREEPTRRDLDAAVGSRPVILYHASGHAAVVNGFVLDAVGYSAAVPDPPGGRLGRGPDGSPNGLLYERALKRLARFSAAAFPPDPATMGPTLHSLSALGLTSVATMNTDPEELEVLAALGRRGELPLRVRAYLRFSRLAEVEPHRPLVPDDPGRLAVRGTKSFTDGAFGPRTAWVSAPYLDRPDAAPEATLTPAELAEVVDRTVEAELVPAIHAIGDRALEFALKGLEGVRSPLGPCRIEHASLVPPWVYPTLDAVRPALVVQPGFVWSDYWLGERIGPAQAKWAYPFRTLLERGHLLVGSSDAPYDPVDPWRGLAAAVDRKDPQGRSANPDPREALGPEAAVQLYTVNAGLGMGEPDLGHLEVGGRADLIMVDGPDVATALRTGSPGVRSTWCGGRVTYRRPGAPGA